ncbi:MAG: DNA methylase [Candidatus Saganbacteria bacterium]|uniref:Methyltransferase n=1 Tax=Candidatus Saganbacteria bacterium TaxID=2575572 RepID=A0A833NRV9_UNCSA|nr:MAG: DNA methylase [Candidatus Saganbacteria bacterium]
MNTSLAEKIVEDKKNGISDKEIGKKFGVNLKLIEKAVTQQLGVNISNPSKRKKKIISLDPQSFELETSTVWSFKSRGKWATHNGNYRGNWSPYIPRNVILRYSKEGDIVLDYFCGGGTTAVESKLLNRNFIGIDINSSAIELSKENLDFDSDLFSPNPSIILKVGDARNLSTIHENSIDLICAHPPYADIVAYSHGNPSDLSSRDVGGFLDEIEKVARESYRVLKPKAHCAILIGDMRKNKNVIPLGFWTIGKYLEAGFKIKELIIKRQHNCKTTGFWYNNSVKYNFLLLAHEYLAIFEKTKTNEEYENRTTALSKGFKIDKEIYLESTTVWIFNKNDWEGKAISNLFKRYSAKKPLLYKNSAKDASVDLIVNIGPKNIDACFKYSEKNLKDGGILAIFCEDTRGKHGLIKSTAMEVEKGLRGNKSFTLKELVILSIENGKPKNNADIEITHKYILIYIKAQINGK